MEAFEGSKFCSVIFNVVHNIDGASNVLRPFFFINFMSVGHVGLGTVQNHAVTPSSY